MSGKLAVALILALQVSMCFSQIPEADPELVDKYEALKKTFIQRIVNTFNRAHEVIAPLAQGSPTVAVAKGYIEELGGNPKVMSIYKIANGLSNEFAPLMEKARLAGLGLYGQYLRPHIGEPLDKAINQIKPILDTVMPADN
uniref:Apolipoprotein A-II n=1 Tax=Denticeps clupeoides TaxID=299321 RepID=A0AAY4AIF2_9TELE